MAPHQATIAISPAIPAECYAGADIALTIQASCPEGCDLTGCPVMVVARDHVLATTSLEAREQTTHDTGRIALHAPGDAGEQAWTVLFPRHERAGIVHEEGRLLLTFTTIPHATSLAVWDVPSPIVINRPFRVKIGVKCAASCHGAGRFVEVLDEAGVRVGHGRLADTPWPDTAALYVADVELTAPGAQAVSSWSARFPAFDPGLPHDVASASFSFRTVKPPEHRVTIEVTDKGTRAPLEHVDVRLGVYRGVTDALGVARIDLPGGVYSLDAWKAGYEMTPTRVDVSRNLSIHIDASAVPEIDPDAQRVWM